MAVAEPGQPKVLLFTPFDDSARICGSPFIDDATHTDTEYKIRRASDDASIASGAAGSGVTHITVGSLSLTAGVTYLARIRYENSAGWSKWSQNTFGTVPIDLPFSELSVPGEPLVDDIAPIDPSFGVELKRSRKLIDATMQTFHRFRRMEFTKQRREVRLHWDNLNNTEYTSIHSFVAQRIRAARGFRTATAVPVVGGVAWFPINGRWSSRIVSQSDTDGPIRTLEVDCIEIFGEDVP